MSITQNDLEDTLVTLGKTSSYLIVNRCDRHYIETPDGKKIGVFSSVPLEDGAAPWEESKEAAKAWTLWQPKGAEHPIFIERETLAQYIHLSSLYTCQINRFTENGVGFIGSFRAFPIRPSTLFGEKPSVS